MLYEVLKTVKLQSQKITEFDLSENGKLATLHKPFSKTFSFPYFSNFKERQC